MAAGGASAADGFWSDSAAPALASDPDTASVEVGLKFQSTVPGVIRGIQFYKSAANGGTHNVRLWNSGGKILASATAADVGATGWQTAYFSTPVAIAANTTYVASYHAWGGRYSVDENYFTGQLASGSLVAPRNAGVYAYASNTVFPTNTYRASNYWVDVVFAESAETPIAGVCGSSNGATLTTAPTSGLCATGNASSVGGTGPWTWSCAGTNGGSTAQCSAEKQLSTPVDGACGPSAGANLTAAPTTGLCSAGTASSITGTGPWSWSCAGTDGGSTAQCSANKQSTPVDGVCGPSAGATFTAAPTTGLCSAGTTSSITGTGPWTWSCAGTDGGSTAQCSANKQTSSVDGVCGPADGTNPSSAPTTGLCSVGTSSAVTGSGPWSWSCAGTGAGIASQCGTLGACLGSATPSPATVVMPAGTPQPSEPGDLVGVVVQNLSGGSTPGQTLTFAQFFADGAVRPSDRLVARISGESSQVQMDALALWPDGSVKHAAITLTPNVCGGSSLPLTLAIAQTGDPVFSTTPVNLAGANIELSVTMNFTGGAYSGQKTIDLGTALRSALASSPDYWLRGPLATQARVDVPVSGGPLHVTADVTMQKDGTVMADVQFNNDLVTVVSGSQSSALPALAYTATIRLQGTAATYTVSQRQYQDWHAVVTTSTGADLNVQHDLAYLQHSGAVLPYDRTTGVRNSLLQSYGSTASSSSFGAPLSTNGVTTYMPTTGGRADIGYTTLYNTAWLLTGDARAAKVALAQGDTGGAVPWNMKLANGRWLTPDYNRQVWSDSRGNPTIKNAISASPWTPETAHQPNLAYVPYLLTGTRWYLDRLNAQAAFGLVSSYPGYRCRTATCDTVINGGDQVRAQAWTFREVMLAANVGKTGSWEQGYFAGVVANNWAYVRSIQPNLAQSEGQAAGWLPGDNRNVGQTAPWQEDYFTGVAVLASLMGDTGAAQFVGWQRPWLYGRFIGSGMNSNDGCAYQLQTGSPSSGVPYTTWSAIESATKAAGLSNGNSPCIDDYAPLARSALGGALTLYPTDSNLRQALNVLNASGAQYITQSSFQVDPTFNVVPLQ